MKRALIIGISGQDGAYLADLLLRDGYEVIGTSRDAQLSPFANLHQLGIRQHVRLHSMALTDFRSVLQTMMRFEPTEVYNLAGQSSVGLSFEQPVETLESIALGTLNVLEVLRLLKTPARFYNACSSECFGETPPGGACETTPFAPRSPYGVAKSTAYWTVANYRDAYGVWACSGILFNHESPLRPERFVTRKVIEVARRIAAGSAERLTLGNIEIQRDWGWAPEYVDAMSRMLRLEAPQDFVIATGETHSLREFVSETFARMGLDYREFVDTDPELLRPSDIRISRGDPEQASRVLGWRAATRMKDVVRCMLAPPQVDAAARGRSPLASE